MRLICFTLLIIVSVAAPWWFALPLWAGYVFVFRGYEIIALGLLCDAYFGAGGFYQALYTLSASAFCLLAEVLRPRIAFYKVE
ncbi:hypothetical protein HY416_00595 [Candidatus Kaiserbacteria bacterium]|nr:hypothetical protein [Candidatus Kaiserbacteria bacterium]